MSITCEEAGRRGGKAVLRKYGVEYFHNLRKLPVKKRPPPPEQPKKTEESQQSK